MSGRGHGGSGRYTGLHGAVFLFEARFEALLKRYLEASDYEMECAEVVGRKFATLEEHLAWLEQGGCASIIDALAEGVRQAGA